MVKRFIVMTGAAALLVAGTVASAVSPSGADTLSPTEVTGNFAGGLREEVFRYTAGPTTDYLVSFSNQGVPGGQLTWATYPHSVDGTYYPVAGNFDGDVYDEIIWHAPGTTPDFLMDFTSYSTTTSVALAVNGDYIPVAGDFGGDGVDDVIWYAEGNAGDFLWDFNPGAARQTLPLEINGTGYQPIAGSFGSDGTDDVLWYGAGYATDFFWDFVAGTHTYRTSSLPVNGTYVPFALDIWGDGPQGGDIFWYAPGSTQDYIWDFLGGSYVSIPETVRGTYRPSAGDLFADGRDDVFWLDPNNVDFFLWDHYPIPNVRSVGRVVYPGSFTAAAGSATGTQVGPVLSADH